MRNKGNTAEMKIEVKNLSFSYDKREILHNVSFSAKEGEFVSILGPNGVGKSTLFRCMLSLLENYSGEVTVDGHNMKDLSIKERASYIAYIPQNSSPAFNYSAMDMVLMGTTSGMSAFGTPGKEEVKRAMEALEKVGIPALKDRCYHHLSGGERQLVIIARALAQRAKILMLDEPTASLDFGNQMRVLRQMKALTKENYTVIQTTHSPEHSYMFSDRVTAICSGKIIKDDVPGNVMTSEIMSQLYGTPIRVVSLENDMARVCLPAETV